jgi:hypothetical protein
MGMLLSQLQSLRTMPLTALLLLLNPSKSLPWRKVTARVHIVHPYMS